MANNFITNAQQRSLKRRIHTLIQHSRELKFLVGFFYFSGWQELYEALTMHDDLKLKILVGLDTDLHLGRVLEMADPNADTCTQQELVGRYFASLRTAMQDEALDTQEFYEQVSFFLHLLEDGRLQIRKTLDPNHAKLYLFRLDEAGESLTNAPGRFITGSSNLTLSGLLGQREFNVEIGDYGWEDAEAYFDDLWASAIPLSEQDERKEDHPHYSPPNSGGGNYSFRGLHPGAQNLPGFDGTKSAASASQTFDGRPWLQGVPLSGRGRAASANRTRRIWRCDTGRCGRAGEVGYRQLAGARAQRPRAGYLPPGAGRRSANQIHRLV